MKQRQESVHNSTREIDHIQTSATVSYMCDGKSHNLLQDATKRSKRKLVKNLNLILISIYKYYKNK